MVTRIALGRWRVGAGRLWRAILLPGLLAAATVAAAQTAGEATASITGSAPAQTAPPVAPGVPLDSAKVVLVTIDGLRWEELFRGADAGLLRREPARATLRARYQRPTPEARRRALLPFLWDSLARHGPLFGNRDRGNYQDLANRRRLSYPGYNELLTGAADDARIRGNRCQYNPNRTVLEQANRRPGLAGRVAAFTSWEAFPFILNQPRSGLLVDAGLQGRERPDSLTFRAALAYLRRAHPRVLYLAFGNTDTFAHHGRYGDYLDAAHAIDGYLAELWATLQADPYYRGRTTLVLTTDHGRGRGRFWTIHGPGLRASAHTWLAVLGPGAAVTGVAAPGEVVRPGQHYQTWVAALLADCLGLPPVGLPVAPAAVATAPAAPGAGQSE